MKITAMKIELTRELKVTLLEAVKSGSLDLSIFDKKQVEQEQSIEDIEREIVRLEMLESKDYLLALSDLMRRYATNELTKEEYLKQRINIFKSKQYDND